MKKGRSKGRRCLQSKLGRNKDEGNLSEEHHDQDDHTAFVYEGFDATEAAVTPDFERKSDETTALRKERVIETERSDTEKKRMLLMTLNFEDEAGPSSPIHQTQEEEPKEQFKDDELLADIILNRPRGLSIPGPYCNLIPQLANSKSDKRKRLQMDEEVARKVQGRMGAEEERKRGKDTELAKIKVSTMEGNCMQSSRILKESLQGFYSKWAQKKEKKDMLQERDQRGLLRRERLTVIEKQPSKKLKLRTETIDELRNYLRIVDFEKSAQDRESLEAISMITEFKVIDSPDGEYLMIYRANSHFRAFDTLWEILHILDRQDLHHLYLVVQDYYKNIPPTGWLGFILWVIYKLFGDVLQHVMMTSVRIKKIGEL
ncbi:hypothetical protein Tco_1102295 [Tanacetum coccineum]